MTDLEIGGALGGFHVIGLTRVLGGAVCIQLLLDHGAKVRDWGPPFKDGLSAYFSGINRNKRSVGLDMRAECGQEVLFQLLEGADVMIDNFKAGSLENGVSATKTFWPNVCRP